MLHSLLGGGEPHVTSSSSTSSGSSSENEEDVDVAVANTAGGCVAVGDHASGEQVEQGTGDPLPSYCKPATGCEEQSGQDTTCIPAAGGAAVLGTGSRVLGKGEYDDDEYGGQAYHPTGRIWCDGGVEPAARVASTLRFLHYMHDIW